MRKRTRRSRKVFTRRQITGALIGCGVAVLGMGFLALLLYGNRAGEGAVGPVNAVLKVLCPFVAGFFALKGTTERPILSGAIAGGIYDILMVLLLCAFLRECHLTWALLGDLIISIATGMAGAMVRGLAWEYGRKK